MLIRRASLWNGRAGRHLGLSAVLVVCLLVWGCAIGQNAASSTSGQTEEAPPKSSQAQDPPTVTANAGLQVLNAYRAQSKLPPITENPILSAGDRDHARYLVKNYGKEIKNNQNLGVNFHLEDTNRPAYTYDGFVAGRASDVVVWVGDETPQAAARAIDDWFSAPFHRFPLLSTHLDQAGYGEYCEGGVCAAALNITSGGVPPDLAYHRRMVSSGSFTSEEYNSTALDTPIVYPADGATVPSGRFDDQEWPDPLSSCGGYTPPTGLPISVQLGSWMKASLTAFSVTVNGASVPTCGFDGSNYVNPEARTQEIARDGLYEEGAVVLIPRRPLPPGSTCKVSAMVNGKQYDWSFMVAGETALK
jgi:hypothetical protein